MTFRYGLDAGPRLRPDQRQRSAVAATKLSSNGVVVGRGSKHPPLAYKQTHELDEYTDVATAATYWLNANFTRHAQATREYYQYNVAAFVEHMIGVHGYADLRDLTPHNVTTFLAVRKATLSAFSARASLITLKAFANWLDRNTRAHPNLRTIGRVKVDENIRRPLTDEEVRAALAAARETQNSGRDYPLVKFFLGTGLRLQECAALTIKDVSFPQRTIFVKTSKNGRSREVTLFDDVGEVLREYITMFRAHAGPNDPLWIDRAGKRMAKEAMRGVARAIQKKSGIKKFGWHICRHTYGHNCRRLGMDIMRLRDEMGHADFKQLARYAQTVPASQRAELPGSPLGIVEHATSHAGRRDPLAKVALRPDWGADDDGAKRRITIPLRLEATGQAKKRPVNTGRR